MSHRFRSLKTSFSAMVAGLAVCVVGSAGNAGAPAADLVHPGRAAVYQQIPSASLERISTPQQIVAATLGNVAPTAIWATLEHGEKVECLDCIPGVARLLYDDNAKTREISAWWLRRRIFGVFGAGEVYSQVLGTLQTGSDQERADAAQALGEFLVAAGIAPVAQAAVTDSAAIVRLAAVRALQRLNSEGPGGELGTAMGDSDPDVRLAALEACAHINVFSAMDAVAARLSDDSADVRRRAAEVLGAMDATDAVVALIALTTPAQEPDPRVRAAAVAALGRIADPSARDAVEAATTDPDPLVASLALIASRRF